MPDPIFAEMYRDTDHLTWEPTERVRQRGRQRTRRTRIAAALASVLAVALIVTGAAALADGPNRRPLPGPATGSPSPTPPPSTVPNRTGGPPLPSATASGAPSQSRPPTGSPSATDPAVPLPAMLQPADVPSGYQPHAPETLGDWTFGFSAGSCRSPDHPLFGLRSRAERIRAYEGGFDKPLNQRVRRYSSADAGRFMDLVRDRVRTCGSTSVTLAVPASGFAGDESLLVRTDFGEGYVALHIFVRQGDLVSEVWRKDLIDPAAARDLGRKVAARLCAGTDAC